MGRRFLFPAFRYKLKQPAWPSSWNLYWSSWALGLGTWTEITLSALLYLPSADHRLPWIPRPPEYEPIPYNKSISPLIYILLVLLLWGNLIQSLKKKTAIKPMVQSLQLMENQKQRTMGNSVSSLEPLFKLKKLNYLGIISCYGWLEYLLASESPSTLGLSELDGFSCQGMGQDNPRECWEDVQSMLP